MSRRPRAGIEMQAHALRPGSANRLDRNGHRNRKPPPRRSPCVAANGAAVASEAAPIQYVAAVVGVTDPEVAIGGWR
jgi:hypothetical protein